MPMSDEARERLEMRIRLVATYAVMVLAVLLLIFVILALLGVFI